MMTKKLVAVITAALVSVAFSLNGQATNVEPAMAPAKVIFYRADESSKTRKIKFSANIDGRRLARLKYNNPVVTMVDAGEYTFSTSIRGSQSIEVDLQPGATYYVHTQLKRLGQTVTPTLVLVEEQVALTQQPAIEGAI